jgi:hypothetical protein
MLGSSFLIGFVVRKWLHLLTNSVDYVDRKEVSLRVYISLSQERQECKYHIGGVSNKEILYFSSLNFKL